MGFRICISAQRQMPNKCEGPVIILYYIYSYPFTSNPISIYNIYRGHFFLICYLAFGAFVVVVFVT